MSGFKKITLAVLALSSSGGVLAGSMGPICTSDKVTIPCEKKSWDFSVAALYLRSALGNDLTYYDAKVTGNYSTYQSYNRWNWAYKLEGAYYFGTGNDITLDWYHLGTSNNYTINSNFSNQLKIQWDGVNVEVGQYTDFAVDQKMRFHAGVTYARIDTSNYANLNNNTTTSHTWGSQYNGFGPRTGLDMAYVLGNGFDLYAKGAAAVLIGHGSFFTYNNHLNYSLVYGSRSSVVPELDARLGTTYSHAIGQGNVLVDAGWMWANYFQAQHKNYYSCDANFSVNGPYIGLNYVGNL